MPHRKPLYERYAFERSPFTQVRTQRDFAALIGFQKSELEAMVDHQDQYIVRRQALIGKKQKLRNLAYPKGRLRTVHARLQFQCNKIQQPDYVFSPRKGRAQRDNALLHVDRTQLLTLDVRQFYPSTSREHVFRWAHHEAGMPSDVAGLFTRLVTVDDQLSFGSPLSPVLATLVHRTMFRAIWDLCASRGLRMSLWVDDIMVSGLFTPGEHLAQIREIIRRNGFQSHKVEFMTGNRPVVVTGVPVSGGRIVSPRAVHDRLKEGFENLAAAQDDWSRSKSIERLLTELGTQRYNAGSDSAEGQKAANRMNALRRRRASLEIVTSIS